MIVPFAAGGGMDAVGRAVVERMRGLIGQPINIENVVGADGSIGVGRAAGARPDGYTIVLGSGSTNVLNGAFYSLQYDVLNDFAPVAPLVTPPSILFAKKTLSAADLRRRRSSTKRAPSWPICSGARVCGSRSRVISRSWSISVAGSEGA